MRRTLASSRPRFSSPAARLGSPTPRPGLGVAIQAIAGGETAVSGTPMTLLLADVLRNESTFDGAVARLRVARVFVSDLILLGDARAGRFAVVEKSPSALCARKALASARRLERDRGRGWLEAAARDARRAHEPAPEFAEAAAKLGELEARRGDRARARSS